MGRRRLAEGVVVSSSDCFLVVASCTGTGSLVMVPSSATSSCVASLDLGVFGVGKILVGAGVDAY